MRERERERERFKKGSVRKIDTILFKGMFPFRHTER